MTGPRFDIRPTLRPLAEPAIVLGRHGPPAPFSPIFGGEYAMPNVLGSIQSV